MPLTEYGVNRLRILHLEDEPLDSELAREMLREAGMHADLDRVDTLENLERALKDGQYSLVLSDYTIPGTDPLEALRLVRRLRPQMPFVFLSGTIGEELATSALKLGANDYVLKQRMDHLAPTIHRALKEADEQAQRRQAQEALRRSEERLRLAQEVAEIGTFEWDVQGNVIQWSREMAALYGLGSDEFDGTMQGWRRCILEEDVPQFQRFVDDAVSVGHVECEWRARSKSGTVRWLATRAYTFRGDDGSASRVVGVNINMTSQKRSEEELRAAKHSAEQAKETAEEANRAKDRFIAILSHELRTPLAAILPALDALEPLVTQDGRDYLEMASRNVELEARLIDDLLDITRIGRGKIQLHTEVMDVRTALRRAVEVCHRDIEEHRLHFKMDIDDVPHTMRGDPARIQQVLWNLIQNAVKFTPTGGCVLVKARRQDGHSVVEVHDSGTGIDSEAMGRIFKAFEQETRTVTRQFGGLGLGLAISKTLVEMHGGTIQVASEGKGKGSVFTVRLPLQNDAACVEEAKPTAITASPQLRILLVEDHPDAARIMAILLRMAGHQVEHAGSVAAAKELLEKGSYDLLLSDLGLPDGSGYDLMREIRAKGNGMPGIALSGYGTAEDIQRSREAGFAEHVVKPVRFGALQESLARVIKPVFGKEKGN